MSMYKILFVCTGNICRSPSADALLRHYVEQDGLSDHIYTDSAGTHSYHVGEAPDARAVAALSGRGVSATGIQARQVSVEDFERFNMIVALDRGHYRLLSKMMPDGSFAALELFMDLAGDENNKDVPDPYYGGEGDFELALDLIDKGVLAILSKIKSEIGK